MCANTTNTTVSITLSYCHTSHHSKPIYLTTHEYIIFYHLVYTYRDPLKNPILLSLYHLSPIRPFFFFFLNDPAPPEFSPLPPPTPFPFCGGAPPPPRALCRGRRRSPPP